jgi:hypothetical protein
MRSGNDWKRLHRELFAVLSMNGHLPASVARIKLDFVQIGDAENALAIDGIELQFGNQSFPPMKDDAERNPLRRNAPGLGEDNGGTAR